MNLQVIKPILERILTSMSKLTHAEFAIFSSSANLISGTPTYLRRKGSGVHPESIEEVIEQGNVVVNKPGQMKSCIGCRFVNNCPSTIEILSCIDVGDQPIGVVSMTSFSQEGHDRIERNIRTYTDILESLTEMIAMFAVNEQLGFQHKLLHRIIGKMVDEMQVNYLFIDQLGFIVHWDINVEKFLPFCDLQSHNISAMFPQDFVDWVLSSKEPRRKYYRFDTFGGMIYVTPLKVDGEILGYTMRVEQEEVKQIESHDNYIDSIISSDPVIDRIKGKIVKIANSTSSVLITGDTGTGKEMIAKAIHYSGSRISKPFVPVNCANIPDTLFESELFGYEDGAFTGAKKGGKPGILEIADGGTVFLDEVGELPLHLQAKLLRVLQEGVIQRIGGIHLIPIRIRIISATNRNLEEMMKEGKFRGDLFYRLNVIPLLVPPLSQRPDDIETLTQHFIEKYSRSLGRDIRSISPDALKTLKDYCWPGNIRELENVIEYAINMEDSHCISRESLPLKLQEEQITAPSLSSRETAIIEALDRHGWNLEGKKRAADELGISLRTLYRRLKAM